MAKTVVINGRKFALPTWKDEEWALENALGDINANRAIRMEAAPIMRAAMLAEINTNYKF